MFSIYICFILLKFGSAQLNGDFWWLNKHLVNYNGVQPPPPKFEELNQYETDENARIVFRDDNLIPNNIIEKPESIKANKNIAVKHEKSLNHNVIIWPDKTNNKVLIKNKDVNNTLELMSSEQQTQSSETGDRFDFKFPEADNFVWKDFPKRTPPTTTEILPTKENITENITRNSTVLYNDKVSFNMHYEEKQSESICTYMKKSECYRCRGVVLNTKEAKEKLITTRHLICCVLPLEHKQYDSSKIYYPDEFKKLKRLRRSTDENAAQNQRKVILQRKYANQRLQPKLPNLTKITTPDYEYDDPYWNIKNIKKPNNKKKESNTRLDYSSEEYYEEYAAEIPHPGLPGLYSDYGQRPPNWDSYYNNKGYPYGGYDDDDNDSGTFGYSTIDPRIVTKSKRGRPQKLTTASDEEGYNAESHTISYHSNPDFNVLQDFKLLNLMRNKNKGLSKISRKTTTESFSEDDDSKESLLNGPFESNEDSIEDFDDRQVFAGCGKAVKTLNLKNKGKQIGDAVNGSHPWLALLAPTHKLNTVLCYATLIHPRAAITAADCVQSKQSAGELTLIAGLWNLNTRSDARTRVISVRLHPQYKHGGLNHNIAVLHWKTPLHLGPNVQPACLANPRIGDVCMFVGWGGFDQAIRPRSRWQRASVHSCKDRLSLNGVNLPNDAFCTSVQARSTVTGIGGSLICERNGREVAVGLAVSRDSTLVMMPVFEWTRRAINVLQD